MVPAKLLTLVSVIEIVPDESCATVSEVDGGIEIVSFELAVVPEETTTVLVLKLVIGPGGDAEAERVIVPAKLLILDYEESLHVGIMYGAIILVLTCIRSDCERAQTRWR